MFLSLDYLYVPAGDIEIATRFYTEQLGGELVWKIHAFNTWVAAVRLSASGPMVLLAAHLQGNTPILIYRVEQLESSVARLRAQGWTPEAAPSRFPMVLVTPFAIQPVFDWRSTKISGQTSPRNSPVESTARTNRKGDEFLVAQCQQTRT